MSKTNQSKKKISKAMQAFDRRSMARIPSKNRSIRIRVTTRECDEIKLRAQRLDVSVSELLRQLFEHAKDRL
jgi:hypothetical protein